jgi:carotenoid cleavage dioxygenase
MGIEIHRRFASTLPVPDDHPYRSGAWRPQNTEFDAKNMPIIGQIPDDLTGIYLRNTENPLHPNFERYHPFDGDGMIHQIAFSNGDAVYRNRFVRTAGLAIEQEAMRAQWSGLAESPLKSPRTDGWGARTRMKDASSTDIVVHGGLALSSFYQCGDLYQMDPLTLEDRGPASWNGRFPACGVSAHTKVDERSEELLFFNYETQAPYMHYGVVNKDHELVHYVPIPLQGARLPHDMAFTDNYAILNDCPLFWDPELMARGVYATTWHPEQPTRFAIIPRRGNPEEIRWFEADPTYVLHWINAFEMHDHEGHWIILDGFFQHNPSPSVPRDADLNTRMFRFLDLYAMESRPHRWRFNLTTGETREGSLSDAVSEFGMTNGRYQGLDYRYYYSVIPTPGCFQFDGITKNDLLTGVTESYLFGEGVFGSETVMAPRPNSQSEDDGYLITFVSDVNEDRSECLVFDAQSVSDGPICRIELPERISSGTHACWAPLS